MLSEDFSGKTHDFNNNRSSPNLALLVLEKRYSSSGDNRVYENIVNFLYQNQMSV